LSSDAGYQYFSTHYFSGLFCDETLGYLMNLKGEVSELDNNLNEEV